MSKYLITVIIILLGIIGYEWHQIGKAERKLDVAISNIKAYDLQLSSSSQKNQALQLTVEQLNTFQDSILKELNETRKELRIKEGSLKSLMQVSSSFSRTDTIIFWDTIYKDLELSVDTLIKDEWYSLKVGLAYPSTLVVRPEFKSDKHIIVYTRKETVNPPSKFFLFRLFQRKHLVLNVDVVENNPYVSNESSRYIEIIQ